MTIVTLLFALIATPSAEGTGEPILLDFQASWCGPCRQMRPAIEQLLGKGYPVKEIDIDRSPDLAARYHVASVPTFIVTDPSGRPLARTEGLQPAAELAKMYLAARAKVDPKAEAAAPRAETAAGPEDEHADATDDGASDESAQPQPYVNPKPWESVVRIKVYAHGAIGFGSGTIIHSTPEESTILTCAHIFKLEGRAPVPPSQFPLRITVDLFDGKLTGQKPAMVHYANETYEGQAIDYDFARDVGLIRIRPGRRLPSSRVVPPHWKPQARMAMITVGCSEGHDATAWSTSILNPSMRALAGNAAYEAIECMQAPKQGRSGGGLFTSDGYIAGVCDFAEPTSNHGLYAAPRSIYQVLDRNNLMALYAPVTGRPPTLLAGDRSNSNDRPKTAPAITRGQSPDGDESNAVTIPPPELLGIKAPAVAEGKAAAGPSPAPRPGGWHRTPRTAAVAAEQAEMTDLKLAPGADSDRFASIPDAPDAPADAPADAGAKSHPSHTKWRPVKSPLPALSADRP